MKLTEPQRHYIYGIALAVIALLAGYAIIGPEDVPLWVGLVMAVLGVGTNAMAVKNTSRKLPPPSPPSPPSPPEFP